MSEKNKRRELNIWCSLLLSIIFKETQITPGTRLSPISKRAIGLKVLGFGFNLKTCALLNIICNHKGWKPFKM